MEWLIGFAPFLMVIAIIWIVSRSKLEAKRLSFAASEGAEKGTQYITRIKDLEDRVRVLERIVTDSGYNVSAQIEALRDTHRVENQDSGVPLDLARNEHAR
jgi:hypothetical protein